MSIKEKFIYKDNTYIVDLETGQGLDYNNEILMVSNLDHPTGYSPTKTKTYIHYARTDSIWTSHPYAPYIPPEIDDGLMLYMQNGGFADLTPVEYLHSLGIICSTSTQP